MTLIHTALFSEAKPLISYFQLKQYDTKPYKIFKNKQIVLIVSGIGKKHTKEALKWVFSHYDFTQSFNIGTAGCSDTNVQIGSFFCSNQTLKNTDFLPLITVDDPQITLKSTATLYDMEAQYFEELCLEYLNPKNIFVFKIVSDHCSDAILGKEFVYNTIYATISQWSHFLNGHE
ncbi:MAG: nucleoside phosphorylase [Campylobacterota bacterium]|nr:nucleoside phosphorylase [Campylobacterota bacterium]